jgi:hypothetical protein
MGVSDEIISWIVDHGQSFDWLMTGDATGLICTAAAQNPHPRQRPELTAIDGGRTD